jgi:hypothetical protein
MNNTHTVLAYAARQGKIQIRRLLPREGKAHLIVSKTAWMEPMQAFATMGRIANAYNVALEAIRDNVNDGSQPSPSAQAQRVLDGVLITDNGF